MPGALLVVVLVLGGLVAALALAYNLLGPVVERRRVAKNELLLDAYCTYGTLARFRSVTRRLPSNPRCKLCYVPFGGVGRLLGIKPSRKNENFCRSCFETAPLGGYETDIGVLFADARGFTEWASTAAPSEVAVALGRFYRGATTTLMEHDAIVDKFMGDEVMAIFISNISTLGQQMCDHMVRAAEEMVAAARESFGELPIGVGLHCGTGWVGNIGNDGMKDFTALGDVVNVASRLQGCAGPGEIVMSEDVYARLTSPPAATEQEFRVKGKTDVLRARVATP